MLYMLRICIGTCTFRYFLLQYLELKVSIKIRISAALFTNTYHFVHSLPQDNLAQQEMVSQQGLLLQQQKQFTSQQLLSHLQYQPSLSPQPQPNLFTQQSTIQTPQPKRHVCIIWQSSCNTHSKKSM